VSDYILNGVIKLKDQTKAGTDSAQQNIGGLEKALKTADAAIKAFALVEVVKAIAELTNLGAQADAVQSRFYALAGGAESAEKMLRAIREATGYAVDNMTAMAAASKYMTLGLADSADSAASLISMAVKLGDQTASTQQRVDDFGALLANQSIPRLDNFGISSAKVRERIAELQAAFPAMSREVAFNQAVLEQGAIALDRLGDSTENQAATLDRAKALWADAKAVIATFVSAALIPAVEGFVKLATFTKRVNDALADNTDAAITAGKGWEEYAAAQYEAQAAAGEAKWIRQTASEMIRFGQITGSAQKALLDTEYAMKLLIDAGIGYGETLSRIDYKKAIMESNALTTSYSDLARKTDEVAVETVTASDVIDRYNMSSRLQLYQNLKNAAANGDLSAAIDANNVKQQLQAEYAQVNAGASLDAWSAMEQYNAAINSQASSAQAAAHELAIMSEAQREATKAAQEAKSAFYDAAAGLAEMSTASLASAQIEILRQSVEDGTLSQQDFNTAQRTVLETFGLLTDAELAGQTRIDELTAAFLGGGITADEYALAMLETKESVDILTEAEQEAKTKAEELAEKNLTAAEKTAILQEKAAGAEKVLYGMTGSMVAAGDGAGGAAGKIDELQGKVDALHDKTITIRVVTEGQMPVIPTGPEGKGQPPIALARGGTIPTNAPVMVGDGGGPELVMGAKGARVMSTQQTNQYINNWGGVSVQSSLAMQRLLDNAKRDKMMRVQL
jgi:hypothetical protein